MSKTVFDLYKVKINFFLNFTSFLAFQKSKNTFPPVAGFKNKICVDFRVTAKIFKGLAPRKEATLRHEILELGSNNNLAQHTMCSIFFLQNHSTLMYKFEFLLVL